MGTYIPTTQQDKQITVDVPADRAPEFYAFFARFLAASEPGGRRRRGPGGPRGRHGHGPGEHHRRCRSRHDDESAPAQTEAPLTTQAEPDNTPTPS